MATSTTSPRSSREFQPTESRVFENTIFGIARHSRANSACTDDTSGASSAVGQWADISSYSFRPYSDTAVSRTWSFQYWCSSASGSLHPMSPFVSAM